MGENNRNDPSVAMDGNSRRRLWRWFLLAGLLLATLVVVGFFFSDQLSNLWHVENDLGNGFPPGALADYVPEDSQVVLAVNVRQLLDTPSGREQLAPALQYLFRRAGGLLRWMDLLGINRLDDLDYLQISFAPSVGDEPLWLVRGRFDRSRIQIGPDKLQESKLDRYRVWEHTDHRAKRTTIIAPVSDAFVACESRVRVQVALREASNPRPNAVRDAILREVLPRVDRRQTIWLAASLKGLGSLRGIEDYWLRLLLRPLMMHAESVYGGILCAEDVRAELHFRAATEEEAASLEKSLQSVRDLAGEGASLLVRQKEMRPLLRLLGSGEIRRDGTMILLRSRLTTDQLGK
jgi:hypothetical protein